MIGNIFDGVLGWIFRAQGPVMPSLRYYPSRLVRLTCMELGICILVICVLAALSISIFQDYRRKARVLHAIVSAPFLRARLDIHLYLAHTGTWPADGLQARTFVPEPDGFYYHAGLTDPAMAIENGAVHLTLPKPFAGRRSSLRPATPAQDPLGPVAWFCATPLRPEGWSVAGEDKTDLPERLIQRQLR